LLARMCSAQPACFWPVLNHPALSIRPALC